MSILHVQAPVPLALPVETLEFLPCGHWEPTRRADDGTLQLFWPGGFYPSCPICTHRTAGMILRPPTPRGAA